MLPVVDAQNHREKRIILVIMRNSPLLVLDRVRLA